MATAPMVQRAYRACRSFVDALQRKDAFGAAAAIAFWFFLSLIPLLALLGFLVSLVARSRGVNALLTPLVDVVPASAEEIVRKELERMVAGTSGVAPLGVVGFLWTASSGLHNLMDVFETAAKVRLRAWWKQRAIALGWVLAGLVAACLLALLLVNVDALLHANDPTSVAESGSPHVASVFTSTAPTALAHAGDRVPSHAAPAPHPRSALKHRLVKAIHTTTDQVVAVTFMLAVGMLLLAGFYRTAVQHPPDVRRRVWPGTFTAVVSWLVVSWGFGLYAVSMSSYALYYGSLAAVAVMMVWLYLTSLSLVAGATVNALLETAARTK